MRKFKYLIVGSGYAGMTAAKKISEKCSDYLIVEKSSIVGGNAKSYQYNNFFFDVGIHGLYSKNQNILDLFCEFSLPKQNIQIKIADYFNNTYLGHPIYLHLNGLEEDLANSIIKEVKENNFDNLTESPNNFHLWCLQNLGKTYCQNIQYPYVKKFWVRDPQELNTEWVEHRLKKPIYKEIYEGYVEPKEQEHYVKTVIYPQKGGFGAFALEYSNQLSIEYNKEVTNVNFLDKIATINFNEIIKYESLIYTGALKEIADLITPCPNHIRVACDNLICTSILLVNISLNEDIDFNYHWLYVINEEIPFARLSKPSAWSNFNAPKGKSSLQAEIYLNHEKNIVNSPAHYIESTLNSLINMKIINNIEIVLDINYEYIKYGNIIFNANRSMSVNKIHDFLQKFDIICCGRYGNWDYSLIDSVITDTREKIDKIFMNE